YTWAQDLNNVWYSWGRNKARGLGNGITLSVSDEAARSEYLNIPAPRISYPFGQDWVIHPAVNINANRAPIANAGQHQYLPEGTTSTTLYGDYSHQQQPTSDGVTVTMTYAWTFISGPVTPVIANPSSVNTVVSGLSMEGGYIFRLTVTNSN